MGLAALLRYTYNKGGQPFLPGNFLKQVGSMVTHFVDVAPLGHIPDVLTYALPPEWLGVVRPGMRVLVPLGKRLVTGCIVILRDTPPVDTPKFVFLMLRGQPALTSELVELTHWMADYYVASWGETIRAALPRALQTE